ncbi:MAG: ankyrin repeat domain-containing protein [Gammaproteobacteria bacterium]|nr:ankyrin repeat domain-containing protein [Gammaproteobacteria bacterium]
MTEETLAHAAAAARDGDVDTLSAVLARSPKVVTAFDTDGRTLLDLACRAATGNIAIPLDPGTPGQHAAVDLILRAGSNPSAADNNSWTPLHTAGMAGHSDLARRLLVAGASPRTDAYGKAGGSPLAYALFYAKAYMGKVLTPPYPDNLRTAAGLGNDLGNFIKGNELTPDAYFGLDFYAPEFFPTWSRTFARQEVIDEALTWAARNNQCEAMAVLVGIGAEVNANPFRGTPLLWACYSDKVEAATWLLDHGADPDLRHDWGGEGHGVDAVAMHLAAQHNCVGCLSLLLDRGADAAILDGAYGGTPAGWAEYGGAADALEILRRWFK